MKKKDLEPTGRARRAFLKTAQGAGALGALAIFAGRSITVEAAELVPAAPEPEPDSGYRETEHIRNYYRTARYW